MDLGKGDKFEKKYAHWLREKLPFYEGIWSLFIGHDGNGWPLQIEGFSNAEEEKRKRF